MQLHIENELPKIKYCLIMFQIVVHHAVDLSDASKSPVITVLLTAWYSLDVTNVLVYSCDGKHGTIF